MKFISSLIFTAALSSAAPQSLPRNVPIVVPLTTVTSTARITDGTSLTTLVVVATKTVTSGNSADPTITVIPKAKRQAVPNCPGKAGTYPPDRISSACSCLVTPAATLSRTTTILTVTVTIQSTVHVTQPATLTTTSTTTLSVVGPATGTSIVHGTPSALAVAAYCSAGLLFGQVNNNSFTPTCGYSYGGDASLYSTATVASYQECADLCDERDQCPFFSYVLNAAQDNCRYYFSDSVSAITPVLNANVDSGVIVA